MLLMKLPKSTDFCVPPSCGLHTGTRGWKPEAEAEFCMLLKNFSHFLIPLKMSIFITSRNSLPKNQSMSYISITLIPTRNSTARFSSTQGLSSLWAHSLNLPNLFLSWPPHPFIAVPGTHTSHQKRSPGSLTSLTVTELKYLYMVKILLLPLFC